MRLAFVDRRAVPGNRDEFVSPRWRELFGEIAGRVGPQDWTVNLVLIADGAMTDLNRDFRGTDGVTDVLSFSYLLVEGPGCPDLRAGHGDAARDLWLDPLGDRSADGSSPLVGEILVAPAFVAGRCLERGWSLETELPLLVVHGCLHILDWEHGQDEERAAMQKIESRVLADVGLDHPLLERM